MSDLLEPFSFVYSTTCKVSIADTGVCGAYSIDAIELADTGASYLQQLVKNTNNSSKSARHSQYLFCCRPSHECVVSFASGMCKFPFRQDVRNEYLTTMSTKVVRIFVSRIN